MAADAGLRALTHLDLDRRARFEVILVDAEAARRDLYDRVLSVFIKVFVKAALARVVEYAELLRRPRERGVSVVADRAVAHRGEHDGHGEFDLRRKLAF